MSPDYITHVCDQLKSAVANHDGATAGRVIRQVAADGHPQLAEQITNRLILTGLRRLAAQSR